MEIIDSTKSLIENIYFISGPLLVLLGLFIFIQIKIAKEQIVVAKNQLKEYQKQLTINSKRQAASIAAEKVQMYINEILPLENKLYDLYVENNYLDFEGAIKDFTNDEVSDWDKDFMETFLKRSDDVESLALNIINRLEAFSVYFIKGIADEKIAFSSVGKSFCHISRHYPTITLLRGKNNPNKHYENLVQLYKCWSKRLESYKVDFDKEKLSKELEEKIKELENINKKKQNIEFIKPIGTE